MTAAVSHRSRVLTALAVALPIPLVAAAGLSLPLPATVARLAAKLVPFANSAAVHSARAGSIVRTPGERKVTFTAGPITSPAAARSTGRLLASPAVRVTRAADAGAQPVASPQVAAAQTETSAPAASASQTDPSSTPAPVTATRSPSPPTTTTTPTPTTTSTPTQQVANTVTTTANNAVSSAANTVTNATSTVSGVIGGVHP